MKTTWIPANNGNGHTLLAHPGAYTLATRISCYLSTFAAWNILSG
jgi:hypothetical protein